MLGRLARQAPRFVEFEMNRSTLALLKMVAFAIINMSGNQAQEMVAIAIIGNVCKIVGRAGNRTLWKTKAR